MSVFGVVVTVLKITSGAFVLALIVIGSFIWREYKRYSRSAKILEKFPTDGRHWRKGSRKKVYSLNEDYLEEQLRLAKKFKYGYTAWVNYLMGQLVVIHPDSIKPVLKQSDPKSRGYHTIKPWLGEGLLIASGTKWFRSRRLLTPAFHFDILKPYVKIYNSAAEVFMEKLSGFAEKGQSFSVFRHASLLTLDIILQCAFSYKTECQTMGKQHPYIDAVYQLSKLWNIGVVNLLYLMMPWLYNMTANGKKFNQLCDFVHYEADRIIKRRKQELEANEDIHICKGNKLDFLDILLQAKDEDGTGMSPEDIRAEVDTFLFEGHDTTSSGVSWALYMLAKHLEHQRKCQQEVDSILRDRGNEDITWEDLSKLHHLSLCLKEILRMYSPVPFIGRRLSQDTEIMGHKVPAGTSISVQIWTLHHHPDVWEDPMTFKPERFLPENMKDKDSFAFLPFSAGPRNCIGQNFALNEEKVVLARLLHRYTFEVDPDSAAARRKVQLVMRSEEEIQLKAIPRNIEPQHSV